MVKSVILMRWSCHGSSTWKQSRCKHLKVLLGASADRENAAEAIARAGMVAAAKAAAAAAPAAAAAAAAAASIVAGAMLRRRRNEEESEGAGTGEELKHAEENGGLKKKRE
mmetsp:Transcript_84913/g.149912  ORF Transcript_84913/g.149912 Transcript_84913/m.149912 type:complete len:111 (-) Transcript_84913:151-483(-)